MKISPWILGLLGLAWTFFSTKYFYCEKCGCCGDTPALTMPAVETPSGPLTFKWDNAEALKGTGFDAYRSSILAGAGMADTLVITGQYRADEANNTEYENLGLARAHAAKALFLDKVPESRIRLASELVTDDMNKTDAHESAAFSWQKGTIDESKTTIIESGNETTILFPFGSAKRERNPEVDSYLAGLCTKFKANPSVSFIIVGHTDNVGDPERNQQLGFRRAMEIREILKECGIDKDRITAESKGQNEPVATNDTKEGRHQNRRVVIRVNQ